MQIYKIYNAHGEVQNYWCPQGSGSLTPDQYCECEDDCIIEIREGLDYQPVVGDFQESMSIETGQVLPEDLILETGSFEIFEGPEHILPPD